eukprot:COSAG01_NODE_22093_length_872_cov_1.031048_1_plen_219_part_01
MLATYTVFMFVGGVSFCQSFSMATQLFPHAAERAVGATVMNVLYLPPPLPPSHSYYRRGDSALTGDCLRACESEMAKLRAAVLCRYYGGVCAASLMILCAVSPLSPGVGASGPVPNLPPGFTKQCSENCPGGVKVKPRAELAVYIYGNAGCHDSDPEIAATAYSKDACGWHYGGFCATAPRECDNTKPGSGCVHGDSTSLLLPPGAHVQVYPQCNIIWS